MRRWATTLRPESFGWQAEQRTLATPVVVTDPPCPNLHDFPAALPLRSSDGCTRHASSFEARRSEIDHNGNTMKPLLPWLAFAMLSMASPSDAGAQPLAVFVTAVKSPLPAEPTEANRQQAWAAYKAADTARKDLEKALKTQYGKKRDKWPAEADERLAAAEEERFRVNADWQYRTQWEPVTEDWRQAIALALTRPGLTGRKEHITSVSSANRAQLILTLFAIRNPSAARNAADDRCAAVRLSRGPLMSPEKFASVPRHYRPRRAKAGRLAGPDEGSPVWQFEGCGLHPYFSTEEAIANIVDDFVGANREVLTAPARQ